MARKKTGGRQKGTPNKVTAANRLFFQAFCNRNAYRLQELWETVADEDPGRAISLFQDLAEFCVPKLSRQELVGDVDQPLVIHFHGVRPPPGRKASPMDEVQSVS